MIEFLTNLLDSRSMPWVTALLLGLMTAISPCPLATNITAIGFISKDLESRNRVFFNGLFYTLDRAITYTLIPLTISSASGLYLPVIFAIATGIPVIIIAWVLAYTVSGIGGVYNKIKIFELWFRRVIAVVFIIVGIYYIIRVYL